MMRTVKLGQVKDKKFVKTTTYLTESQFLCKYDIF